MPYTKVYIHYIWATKNREPLINKELKPILLRHIKENSIKKGIFIDTVNCVEDHIHMLISLGTEQTIAKTAMLIKGESSYWVNKQGLVKSKFEWQDEYIALSVSYSAVDKVRAYIINQEEHHKKKTFAVEYEEFLKDHKLESVLAKANSDNLKKPTT
ncbi:MAG: transposase [Bacteroidia bacterium]|nr:transposase [Bacteroidia bacterium]